MSMVTRRAERPILLLLAAILGIAGVHPAPASWAQERPPRTPPPPLEARPLEFPGFSETRLPNGLSLVVVERPVQPIASVSLYVRSGGAVDPAEQIGRAEMTAELLTKGTTTRTATQISEAIEGVGGSLSAGAGSDWVTISSTVLAEHLPLAFELLSDAVLNPTFPADELELDRRRTLSGLQAALADPGEIARRRFIAEVYGQQHPYGTAPTMGTVQAIQRDDLVRFHQEHFTAGNSLLVVSGAVRADEVERLALRHFGGWAGGQPPARAWPAPPLRERMRIYLVHRPGAVQSNILIGHLGIRPDNPDFFPLQVLNGIIGGGTDARLFQILREEKGWTYGAYSRLTRPVDIGFFQASAEVRTEMTDSAVAEMLRQLRRIREEPVPAEEFHAAQAFLAGSFPLRIETPGQIAGQIAQARLLGLPIEDVREYRERILAVTPGDVQRVAREYILPEQAAVVVVGDARAIRSGLEAIGPVVLYDAEGAQLEWTELEVQPSTRIWDAQRLEPWTLEYRLMVQGNSMGTAISSLSREGEEWVATSRLDSPMMGQDSEVRFGATDLRPVASRMLLEQGPMRLQSELRIEEGRIRGSAEMPPQLGGTRDVDTELVAGTLLPGMDVYALAVADLEPGAQFVLPIFDVTAGAITEATFRVTGTENVTVPAGEFESYVVEMTGPQNLRLHVRRQAPHLVLRQEILGMPVPIATELVRVQ